MSQFQKIKVSVNQNDYEAALATSEGRIEFYQSIVDQIKEVIPDFVFESNDLQPLFNNAKVYLVDKIIKEPTSIGGLDLCKNKVFELLTDSDRLQSIVDNVQKLKSNNSYNVDSSHIPVTQRSLNAYSADYEITPEYEVILKTSAQEKLLDQYSIFVKTQRQKEAHDSLLIILDELNKLHTAFGGRSHIKFIEENIIRNYHGEMQGINYAHLHTLE